MFTVMIKWNKHCQKLKIILSLLIAFSLIFSVGAACLRPQIVCASVAGTIAGYILTLFASFNTAITNPQVVDAINNTFGQMSMVEADAALIDQGIASIAASTGFDMASIFANTAEEAAQVIASLPAGSVTEEAIAATAGVNIAAGAGACAASATGAVLPAIGGLVLPAAGAVALGVAGGFLINHIRERISPYLRNNFNLNIPGNVISSIGSGSYNFSYVQGTSYDYKVECDSMNVFSCGYLTGNGSMLRLRYYNNNDSDIYLHIYQGASNWYQVVHAHDVWDEGYWLRNPNGGFYVGTLADDANDANLLFNANVNNLNTNKSRDIIGDNGNLSGYRDNDGDYNIPNIYPVYNYGNTVINYINPTDYQTFIQNANQNTDDGLTGEDTQGNYFDNFVTPYIQSIDEIPDNPNPDIPNPEQKPTVPYPDPEEYPDAIPEVNPVPDTDIAPTAIPYPELPEPTDTEITETNDKITPFDLKNKFPFCLPFDIHKALSKLKGAREAPYFVWQIPFGDAGEQTVTVDLRAWDEVASILRLLELLLFIVGLAVATRNLIGGT